MRINQAEQFKKLHSSSEPLVLLNIWDCASAMLVQNCGASALATSSASLAWANGYPDGGKMPIDLLLDRVANILRCCNVPLTVDIEQGYSDCPQQVANLVLELVELGVSGINIEDGTGEPSLLSEKILSIRSLLNNKQLFINARTDVYLQSLVDVDKMLDETTSRINDYLSAGADGAFIPAVTSPQDILTLLSLVSAPLNLMIANDMEKLQQVSKLGVSRISLGPASFIDTYSNVPSIANKLLKNSSSIELTYDSLNEMF